jgi:KaiC/GvpD/RAD55 family RecA-like ATPase
MEAAYFNDFVLIKGSSGTGKTLLAKILAEKEADTGRKVLLLTFTEPLGKYLENQISHPNITVSPIGKLALSKLREAGFNKPEEYSPEFWNEVTKKAAKNKSIWKKFCFDTIIIDEVQDFGKYEWKIIEKCSKKNKRIWAFKDENQLFWDKKQIPRKYKKKFFTLDLSNNYRCPPEIQILANLYSITTSIPNTLSEEDFKIIKEGLEKHSIRLVITQKELIHDKVGETINDLIHKGFKPSEIAIISLRGRMFKENIMHRDAIGGHRIFDASDERNRNNIIADTFLRFKGLERLAIIITDLRFASKNYRTRMYIALSRAFGIIRIVTTWKEVEKDWILKKIWEEQQKLGN